jgi:AcrR family transcriptional regulator
VTETASRTLRKDAARNRERLLDAARELFAERGLNVTLNDIAHHAGVGVGTAYRRFANKQEVINALFDESLEEVAALAHESLSEPDAWRGLTTYLERSLDTMLRNRALTQIMNNPALGDERVAQARDRIAPLLHQLVERAKADGCIRADLDQSDLVFIQEALSAVMDRSRTIEPDLYRRYLTLFLDGIRTERDSFLTLPVGALSANQTHAAMTLERGGRRGADTAGLARTGRS